MMLSEIVSKWNPWPALKEGSVSMLSDGKISIKRVLSLMAFVLVAHLVVRVLVATKELPNKDMILHMFDGLLLLIATLTGASTWKDVQSQKITNGSDKPPTNV
jgi:uncharacterized membrane protein HdeD (DUF308 family)